MENNGNFVENKSDSKKKKKMALISIVAVVFVIAVVGFVEFFNKPSVGDKGIKGKDSYSNQKSVGNSADVEAVKEEFVKVENKTEAKKALEDMGSLVQSAGDATLE